MPGGGVLEGLSKKKNLVGVGELLFQLRARRGREEGGREGKGWKEGEREGGSEGGMVRKRERGVDRRREVGIVGEKGKE